MPDGPDHGISAGRKLPALTDANRFQSDCAETPRFASTSSIPKNFLLARPFVDPSPQHAT
jgi:hypothetical protein